MDVAKTLRELRLMRGLTQNELAQRMQVTQAQISQTETGKWHPSLNVLESYLAALDARLIIELYEGGIYDGSGLDAASEAETGSGEASDGWEAPPIR